MQIEGEKIILRSVLPSDADLLFKWENDTSNWDVSGTKRPFTRKEIHDFIADQKDIYVDKQLRLMISLQRNKEQDSREEIGCIDLFQFDEKNLKAGIGILIEELFRKNNYASEALSLLIQYCFKKLHIICLYCNISESNTASMRLFQKHKFIITGKKNDVYSLELTNNSTKFTRSKNIENHPC